MSTTTAVLLFILVGYSLQQDGITLTCDYFVQSVNDYCLSTSGFTYFETEDATLYGFCSRAVAFTQCVDASCMSSTVQAAVTGVVPALNRPNMCSVCYDQPKAVQEQKQTCTVWGYNHVVPFNRKPETCVGNTSFIIFSSAYFTLTAESSPFSPFFYYLTSVRFDYHLCAVYSKTWKVGWTEETIQTQGWFPHLIKITQNITSVFIELPAINTEILISAGAQLIVTVSTGLAQIGAQGGVCTSNTCSLDDTIIATQPTSACSSYPKEFRLGKI